MSIARIKLGFTVFFLLVCFAIALALGGQNTAEVSFNYLAGESTFTLSQLLGLTFLVGFMVSWLLFGLLYWNANRAKKRLTKKLKHQQAELDKLRAEQKRSNEAEQPNTAVIAEPEKG